MARLNGQIALVTGAGGCDMVERGWGRVISVTSATALHEPEADPYKEWARWVDGTGGDEPETASDLIVALLRDTVASIDGRFLWIKDGLRSSIPRWGELAPNEVWTA